MTQAVCEGSGRAADPGAGRSPVEITHANAGKAERYAEMGVRELWRLHGRKGRKALRAELLALRAGRPPERLDASEVLEGLTPEDINEAVGEMWTGRPPSSECGQ